MSAPTNRCCSGATAVFLVAALALCLQAPRPVAAVNDGNAVEYAPRQGLSITVGQVGQDVHVLVRDTAGSLATAWHAVGFNKNDMMGGTALFLLPGTAGGKIQQYVAQGQGKPSPREWTTLSSEKFTSAGADVYEFSFPLRSIAEQSDYVVWAVGKDSQFMYHKERGTIASTNQWQDESTISSTTTPGTTDDTGSGDTPSTSTPFRCDCCVGVSNPCEALCNVNRPQDGCTTLTMTTSTPSTTPSTPTTSTDGMSTPPTTVSSTAAVPKTTTPTVYCDADACSSKIGKANGCAIAAKSYWNKYDSDAQRAAGASFYGCQGFGECWGSVCAGRRCKYKLSGSFVPRGLPSQCLGPSTTTLATTVQTTTPQPTTPGSTPTTTVTDGMSTPPPTTPTTTVTDGMSTPPPTTPTTTVTDGMSTPPPTTPGSTPTTVVTATTTTSGAIADGMSTPPPSTATSVTNGATSTTPGSRKTPTASTTAAGATATSPQIMDGARTAPPGTLRGRGQGRGPSTGSVVGGVVGALIGIGLLFGVALLYRSRQTASHRVGTDDTFDNPLYEGSVASMAEGPGYLQVLGADGRDGTDA